MTDLEMNYCQKRRTMTCRASIHCWLNHKAADIRYDLRRWEHNHRIMGRVVRANICHFMQMKLRLFVFWTYKKYLKEMEQLQNLRGIE